MARAKRTDRAEVRRRYRAELAELAAEQEEVDAASSESPAAREVRQPRPSSPANPPAPQRVGFIAGLRSAYQIADVRADLRAFPTLLRGRSFLVPAGLSAASTIVALATVGVPNFISLLLVMLFLGPLPIGAIYAAGVLAPRASYLMGGAAAFVGTVGYVVLFLAASSSPLPLADAVYALVFYTFFGGLIGAGLGFYRRLLRAMNPNDGRRPAPGTRARMKTQGAKAPNAKAPSAKAR